MRRSIRTRVAGAEVEAHPVVFPLGAALVLLFVALAAWMPGHAMILFDQIQGWIARHFSWLYVVSMTGFLVFAVYLCFSRFGSIRLGKDGEEPEFHTLSWFAMLFSAGMGIGMLFYGVAEPMLHFTNPPVGTPGTMDAAKKAMSVTLFHWGLHPWGLYALVGLALAYFGFRRGLPLSFRSVFYPLLGNRIYGSLGDAIDVTAILATLFGLATSLGLGAKQVNAGLNFVFGWPPQETSVQVVLIACITAMAVVSLVSGLHVGIKWFSNINMGIAAFLLLSLFVIGPTVYLLGSAVQNVGAYLQDIPYRSFWTASYQAGSEAEWFGDWTIFYWGWWIAWSPFVGMFIARISRGRTIREFIAGVVLVPTLVGVVWMTGFGNTALHQEIYETAQPELSANGRFHDYRPKEYPVQVHHEEYGLPMTADGRWLVHRLGPGDVAALVDPDNVEVHRNPHGAVTVFHTPGGTPLVNRHGVLVHAETGTPFWPGESSRFQGRYQTTTKLLTLGDFLQNPVLGDDGTPIDTVATAMFVMLSAYPLAWLTALLGTISAVLFFVTSSDSASMVADIIASGGSENPTTGTRLFWGILEGTLAAVLLVAGGLKALQTGSITLGLPFCIVVIVMCYSLLQGLRRDEAVVGTENRRPPHPNGREHGL